MDRLLTISSYNSELSQDYFPPIELNSNCAYALGLYSLHTFNSIPNVIAGVNNKFYYSLPNNEGRLCIEIPQGAYEIEAIEKYLHDKLKAHRSALESFTFRMKPNLNTLQVDVLSSFTIDFNPTDSIGSLIGFKNIISTPNQEIFSNNPVQITTVDVINIECNIIEGSFINGKPSHTLFSFHPHDVPPGVKISQRPTNVLYLSLIHI